MDGFRGLVGKCCRAGQDRAGQPTPPPLSSRGLGIQRNCDIPPPPTLHPALVQTPTGRLPTDPSPVPAAHLLTILTTVLSTPRLTLSHPGQQWRCPTSCQGQQLVTLQGHVQSRVSVLVLCIDTAPGGCQQGHQPHVGLLHCQMQRRLQLSVADVHIAAALGVRGTGSAQAPAGGAGPQPLAFALACPTPLG